jgi:hypothetical protein
MRRLLSTFLIIVLSGSSFSTACLKDQDSLMPFLKKKCCCCQDEPSKNTSSEKECDNKCGSCIKKPLPEIPGIEVRSTVITSSYFLMLFLVPNNSFTLLTSKSEQFPKKYIGSSPPGGSLTRIPLRI